MQLLEGFYCIQINEGSLLDENFMNQQQRIRSQRLKQTYKNQFGAIQLEDDEMFFLVQDDQILQGRQGNTIVIDDNNDSQEEQQVQGAQSNVVVKNDDLKPNPPPLLSQQLTQTLSKAPAPYQPARQRPVTISDIQTKVNIESDDEEKQNKKGPSKIKQVRFDDEEHLPQVPINKAKDYFQQIKQRVTTHLDARTAIQVEVTIKPRPEDAPTQQTLAPMPEISYSQFRYMQIKEKQEAKMRVQLEQEKKKYMKEKQLEKQAPHLRKEGESIQQYMDRMVQLMKKENKSNRKRYKKGEDGQTATQSKKRKTQAQLDEEKMIQDIMRMVNGEPVQIAGLGDEPQIKPPPVMLNYDVLFKTGKILKQAMMKPPEPDYNPIADLYKGRYASEFVFNGALDMEDGPYGQKPKKNKVKLPFPRHKLSLNPWEYYGVSPEEYFATKDPHFTFKAKYVPVKDYYNELPRPKPEPKYYQYEVDQLLAKRFYGEEIQFQAQFTGYQKKHWTPLKHLRGKCPAAVLQYEQHERNRLYCELLNVKVRHVKNAFSLCMLSHRIIGGKREAPQVIYLKGGEQNGQPNGQLKKSSVANPEKPAPEQEKKQEYTMMMDPESDSEEENSKKRKANKEERHLQDDWDPTKDETVRAQRNKQRKEKMLKLMQEQEDKRRDEIEKKLEKQQQRREQGNGRERKHKEKDLAKRSKKRQKESEKYDEGAMQFELQLERRLEREYESEDIFQDQLPMTDEDRRYQAQLKELEKKKAMCSVLDVDIGESLRQLQM